MPSLINLREVPFVNDVALYDFLLQLRNVVVNIVQTSVVEPRPVINFTVTPGPGSNYVQFTRSDGDSYAVYINEGPQLNGAIRYDLGLANTYMHDIGLGAATRFYWIKTKLGQLESAPVGPVRSTTLSLTAPITEPVKAPPAETNTQSNETGVVTPYRPNPLWQEIL